MRDQGQLELLSGFVDGELSPEDRSTAEELLAGSRAHRQVHDELLALRTAFASFPRYELPDDFAERVVAAAFEAHADQRAVAPATATRQAQPTLRRWHTALFVAASLAAVLLIVFLPGWLDRGEQPPIDGLAKHANGDADAENARNSMAEAGVRQDKARIAELEEIALAKAEPGAGQQGEYLFVVDVTVSSRGREQAVFEQCLAGVGIPLDSTIQVERELETALLESRFLENVAPRSAVPDESGTVQLLYVTGTGEQIDLAVADLQSRPHEEVKGVRFDLAIEPSELELFEQLQRAARPEFASADTPGNQSSSVSSRASWLTLSFALFSTSTQSMLTYTPPTADVPRADVQSAERAAAQPRGTMQGEKAIYRVLVLLRHQEP